jgi:hypothetical protein
MVAIWSTLNHPWIAHGVVALSASVMALALTWIGARGPLAPNDYFHEAAPSYDALAHGHLLRFLQLAPLYGGSLVLRAPFAMAPTLWDGGARDIYAASALPCVIALVAFTVWVSAQPRRRGPAWAARIVAILCCAATPYTAVVLHGGHPEELLGAVLCVAAVLAAVNGRVTWAGLLIGFAVANKQWALVALPVVIAVLPSGRRRALLIATATVAVVLGPVVAARQDHLVTGSAGTIHSQFLPPQLLWWLGRDSLIARWAHPLIIVVSATAVAIWCRVRPTSVRDGALRAPDALLMLAFVLLLRAALDPWNNISYEIPFLFALLASEVRAGRPPLLMTLCGIAFLIVMQALFGRISDDLRAAMYAAIALPMLGALAARLYLPNIALPSRETVARPAMPPVSPFTAGDSTLV